MLNTLTVGGEPKDLAKMVKNFPVRAGEKPWTAKEVTAVADELVAERERLEGELANADADLTDLLRNAGDGVYELTKMAVEPALRGAGIGRALLEAAIDAYRGLGGRELYLESSSVLVPALRMYESAGFVHHPAPRPGSHYARADVHMVWEAG